MGRIPPPPPPRNHAEWVRQCRELQRDIDRYLAMTGVAFACLLAVAVMAALVLGR